MRTQQFYVSGKRPIGETLRADSIVVIGVHVLTDRNNIGFLLEICGYTVLIFTLWRQYTETIT